MIAQQLKSLATHLEDPGFILRNHMGLISKALDITSGMLIHIKRKKRLKRV